MARWYELMLDEIDYGVLLLDPRATVMYVNHMANRELDAEHPLQLMGKELRARHAPDALVLDEALQRAAQGLRSLIVLGEAGRRVAVSVVPLGQAGDVGRMAIQLALSKRQVCAGLSVQWFARSHGLTQAETRVLEGLSEGLQPAQIAAQHGVGLSTVRSQIGSIRAKTRSDSIGALVRQVAVLPPLVGVLRGRGFGLDMPASTPTAA